MTRSDTSHIEACRRKWADHFNFCPDCMIYYSAESTAAEVYKCSIGQVLYDEYRSAITANRDCEHLEAKAAE